MAAPASAIAADVGDSRQRCVEQTFAAGAAALRLGRASGASRVDLLGDDEACPGPGAACRSGAFAMPGQPLLLGISRPGYVCAFAASGGPGNVGWVPLARLAPAMQPVDPTPPLAAWLGTWRAGDNKIALSAEDARLSAEGEAYWPGKHIMPANEGAVVGAAAPSGNRLRIVADACEVEMILAGPFLVVTDNRSCGGMNVSFNGIYTRRPGRAR